MARLVTVLLAALVLLGAAWALRGSQRQVADLVLEKKALGDSLEIARAVQRRLAQLADSLRLEAGKRDTVWLRAAARSQALRDSVLPNPTATPEALREVIAADVATINACSDAKATCEERREVAEAERDEAKRYSLFLEDSLGLELDQSRLETRAAERETKKARVVTVGMAIVALITLIFR